MRFPGGSAWVRDITTALLKKGLLFMLNGWLLSSVLLVHLSLSTTGCVAMTFVTFKPFHELILKYQRELDLINGFVNISQEALACLVYVKGYLYF